MLAVNRCLVLGLATTALTMLVLPASAPMKLKWANIYETSDSFHARYKTAAVKSEGL
jgi:hypothetical protein